MKERRCPCGLRLATLVISLVTYRQENGLLNWLSKRYSLPFLPDSLSESFGPVAPLGLPRRRKVHRQCGDGAHCNLAPFFLISIIGSFVYDFGTRLSTLPSHPPPLLLADTRSCV